MEIKIKTKLKELDLTYIDCYHFIEEIKTDWTIKNKIKLVKLYTKQDVSKVKVSDVNKVFEIILKVLSSYKPKEIPLTLEYENKEYDLVTDYFKLPAGWFIDSESADFKNVPELLPAFAYIEKGRSYAEIDENENIINPLKNRAEVFRKNMSLSSYLDLTNFFLLKQKQYKIFSTLALIKSKEKKQSKLVLNGSRLFTQWLRRLKQIGKVLLK